MSDILEQIQELNNMFSNLFEKGITVDKWAASAQKRIDDNPHMGITSHGKEELERLREIAKLPRDGRSANEVKQEADRESDQASAKAVNAMLKGDKEEQAKQEEIAWTKGLVATGNKGFCLDKWRAQLPKKMNDNNSYNEILNQILTLQEQFSNLFEVDGLGNAAVDIPPSQNKIKKDVKTKDGKAELVSVEDELFPYEGDKREQYRQKILSVINGMIQGTATLEDLLQIARQKKAPLKEAMEVLEELINVTEDGEIQPPQPPEPAHNPPKRNPNYEPGKKKVDPNEFERILRRVIKKTDENSLKEALSIMEDLFSTIMKQPIEDQGALVYKYRQAKNKENAGKDTYTLGKEEEKRKSKEEKGHEKTELRKKYRGKSVEDWKLGRLMDQIAKNAKNLGKVEDSATAKAIRRNAQKADLKEAIEIMEAIINEVSIGKWKEAAASSLPKRQEGAEAAKAAAEKGCEEYDKVSREHPEDEPALYRLAQAKDEEAAKTEEKADHAYAVTRLQTHDKADANKSIKAAKKVQDKREDEFGRNPEKRTFLRSGKANQLVAADPVKSRADEALEEALDLLSELTESEHCAHKKNPVVKITDKNYGVAHGKGLPGPFNKNHVGQYIVYNPETDASYLVSQDNWNKSKIKKDLEKQGKVFESFEEFEKVLEGLFNNPGDDILDDITGTKMTGVERIRKVASKLVGNDKKKKKVNSCESLEEAK